MKTLIKSWTQAYTATGKFWLGLACFALLVDAAISYKYGISLSWFHGVGFALVAVFFSLLPDAAYLEIEHKRFASGLVLALLCLPLGAVALYSHLGYGASIRVGDVQQTTATNASYKARQDSSASEAKNLDMWRKQLADLLQANEWAASVKADALRSQVETASKAIALETERGGCKAKCEQRMRDRDAINEKIGKIEQVADLTKRIEATQRILDTKTDTAAKTEYKSSAVVNQTNVAAQLYLAMSGETAEKSIDPDKVTFSFVNIFIAGAGSLAFMIMAPVGFFVAGRNRREGFDQAPSSSTKMNPVAAAFTNATRATPPAGSNTHGVNTYQIEKHVLPDRYRKIMDAIEFASVNHRPA